MNQAAGKIAVVVMALVLSPSVLCHEEEVLTNADIVSLSSAGLSASAIVAKIDATKTDFDTSVEQLVALSQAGVDDSVIEAMINKSKAAAQSGETFTRPQAMVRQPGDVFADTLRSGTQGPEMVVIPAGSFSMGCVSGLDCEPYQSEKPVHLVTISKAFAVSKYEITFEDYDRFTYPNKVDDRGWGRGNRPVIEVSVNDAREYVAWLSSQTGQSYRLLTEAEWEYAARAGSSTKYSWGNDIKRNLANCDGCGSRWDNQQTAPAGSFGASAFGLHDMHGNVWEWVEDCWEYSYVGAPSDGSARRGESCETHHSIRGGTWNSDPQDLRSAARGWVDPKITDSSIGFRVARALAP